MRLKDRIAIVVGAGQSPGEGMGNGRATAITAYGIQLLLNALWAPLFFGLKSVGAGLFCIVALWLGVGWTMREFTRVKSAAALILVPYFLWVTFAAAINLAVWKLNP